VEIVEGSELVGKTLEELDFRNRTGASVVAIQREDETESNPGPETVIEVEDTLIVIGEREACSEVESLAAGEPSSGGDEPGPDEGADA
jgi:TrkA domain protein